MKFFYPLLLLIGSIYQFNQTWNKTVDIKEEKRANASSIMEWNTIRTNKLITTNATKTYSTKNRKGTQYALDKNSRYEKSANFVILISDEKVLICDYNNNVLKELTVIKQWTDKSGPSTVYDLRGLNETEYSLDHYVDYQNKNFLSFRFGNCLETYTDE